MALGSTYYLFGIEGFYLLTAEGMLGYYDNDKSLVVDMALTEVFRQHTNIFLESYRKDPDQEGLRIATIVLNSKGKKWSSPTLVFSDSMIRHLYSTRKTRQNNKLTEFQLRNKERSIYQGMELLLEYRIKSMPGTPIYCPVLYDRDSVLNKGVSGNGSSNTKHDVGAPVLEVLNLITTIPLSERNTPQLFELIEKIRKGGIRKELRKSVNFGLVGEPVSRTEDVVLPPESEAFPHARPSGKHAVHRADPTARYEATYIDPHLLKSFSQFRYLSDEQMFKLEKIIRVEFAPAGHCLAKLGTTDNWDYYLLEGTLELEGAGDAKQIIEGGTGKAGDPISHLKPHKYKVTALSPVKFFRVKNTFLKRLISEGASSSIQAEEVVGVEQLERSQLFRRIYADLLDDHLLLPSLPEVALRIRRTLDDDLTNAEMIARVVETDPAITAKIMKAANSGLYHGQSPALNCTAAVVRLGIDTTRQLVTAFAMHELFQSKLPLLKKRMRKLWTHSTEVAELCYVLARITPQLDPERALLAGLLHDIGIVAILNYAEAYPHVIPDQNNLEGVIEALRGQIGGAILRKWQFDEDIITAAVESDDWFRDSGDKPDYCDLVLIAQLHSFVDAQRIPDIPPMNELPAFAKLALGKLTPRLSLEILHQAKDEISELHRLFVD